MNRANVAGGDKPPIGITVWYTGREGAPNWTAHSILNTSAASVICQGSSTGTLIDAYSLRDKKHGTAIHSLTGGMRCR